MIIAVFVVCVVVALALPLHALLAKRIEVGDEETPLDEDRL